MKANRPFSFLIVIVAYLIAVYAGYWYLQNPSDDVYLDVLIADIIATAIIFAFSLVTRNSSMYDPYWSVIPPLIVLYLMQRFPEGNDMRQIFILIGASAWAIRLTVNWIRGWTGLNHEDWRYIDLAKKTGKWYWLVSFSGIHLFPTLIVFLGCLPVFYAIKNPAALGIFDYLGLAVCLIATLIELVSDEQMKTFKKTAPKGSIMNKGLWQYSRHPNYFGEILFWVGLFVFAIPFSITSDYWVALGWISMVILFVFISVPMMDERSLENKPGYKEHMEKIPALFPSFRKRT